MELIGYIETGNGACYDLCGSEAHLMRSSRTIGIGPVKIDDVVEQVKKYGVRTITPPRSDVGELVITADNGTTVTALTPTEACAVITAAARREKRATSKNARFLNRVRIANGGVLTLLGHQGFTEVLLDDSDPELKDAVRRVEQALDSVRMDIATIERIAWEDTQ